ncbi:MAG: NADH:flavin oxidoreductase/NADH oxidase [Burkholderiales bacterium]|nr:NADH:flavin oxidoreductase/NADH oxidase [Burkholderiales bacterium]
MNATANRKPLLFTPTNIREVTFKNRVVISPMATYSAVDGLAQDFHFAHWGRLILGGAGCVFVEATAVTEQGRITNGDLGLWSDAHIPGLKRVARFMKTQNVVPAIQLGHAGRKGSMQRPWFGNGALTAEDFARGEKKWDTVAPTATPMAAGHIVPHQLTIAELGTLKDHWAQAARRAIEAEFDVLEIHNAHGYLMHQFLSPISNTRDDAYGGDLKGRMRFPLEVAEALRETWPQDKPVFVRVSAVDGLEGGWTMNDTVAYAKDLKARGIDVVDCSSGGLFGSATAARIKRSWGFQVPYAERLRHQVGIKTMAVGLIMEPSFAEDILEQGKADLIAIAREALVNPCWPQMAEIALGRKAIDAMDDWPVQYGWWLKHRERTIDQIRADEAISHNSWNENSPSGS